MSNHNTAVSLQSALQAHKEGDLKLAKALYVEVLSINENNVQALCNLGVVYKQLGSFSLSLSNLNKAIMISPKHVPSYINLATLYQDMKDFDKAIGVYKQALHAIPNDANLYNHLAIVYEKLGKENEALHFYKEAIKRDTKFVKAYNNIGVILYKQKRFSAACEMFKMALDVDKNYLATYTNLGAAYNKAKRYEEAEKVLNDVIMIDDTLSGAHANLGNVYNKMKRYEEALIHHTRALTLDAKSASNHANIGITYKNISEYEKAKEALEQAIMIDPAFVNAHFDLATTYLLLNEYEKGFTEYEWRFKKEEMQSLFLSQQKILQSPKFTLECQKEERTLLLYSEQGFGDIIQFSRFATVLKEKFPSLTLKLQVRPELKTLMRGMSCFDEIVSRDDKLGAFDYQLALMSLPHLLGTSYDTLPTKTPYISVSGHFDVEMDMSKLNIGVVWGASNTGESYEDKVFSLKYFKPFMEDEGIQLYSLQVAGDVKEIKELGLADSAIVDLEEKLSDFKQTALAIESLDIVITSDTSVAHLAGAMGKEAWVVLQKNADWRWGVEDSATKWYPTLKLFRQEKKGDWESAFAKVYKMIEKRKK